jgi:hypothetical protein
MVSAKSIRITILTKRGESNRKTKKQTEASIAIISKEMIDLL